MSRQAAAILLAIAVATLHACGRPVDGIDQLQAEARVARLVSPTEAERRKRIESIRRRAEKAAYDPALIPD